MKAETKGLDLPQKDKTVTLGDLLPKKESIKLDVEPLQASSPHCLVLLDEVVTGINNWLKPMYVEPDYQLAFTVHPKHIF